MGDNHQKNYIIGFCTRCGINLKVEPEFENIPVLCPSCRKEINEDYHRSEEIIFGSYFQDYFNLVTYAGDLGPPNKPVHIDRWPHQVFQILKTKQKICYPATCWTFHQEYLPAIITIIQHLNKNINLLDR
ncbi:MAG: hypothetical protein ACQES9_01690 [Myxococcota bacterium]